MASVVDICNAALARLALGPITALDDASRQAELCSALYAPARDAVLEDGRWSFATQRRSIAADATAPAWGPTHRFLLPSTVLLVLEASDGSVPLEGWRREGSYVVVDYAGPVKVRCVERVEDPTLFTPGAVDALVCYLAYKLCVPMTENRSLAVDLWAEYRASLKKGMAADGLQGRARSTTNSWLTGSRG